MTSDCDPEAESMPVLVLGLGNSLLGDDGVGLRILENLQSRRQDLPGVEFLDGGTQGIALLPRLEGRRALLILDAVELGDSSGTVHFLNDLSQVSSDAFPTAHGANAGSLLAVAALCGARPEIVMMVGVEPHDLSTRVGLSGPVEASLAEAVERALVCIDALSVTTSPQA